MFSITATFTPQALGQIELIARQLQHIDRLRVQLLKVEHADADIAANPHILAAHLQDMADQGRRGRFSVGARDAHDARTVHRLELVQRAREQLHVANDRHAHHLRHAYEAMRFREAERNPRRQNEGCKRLPVAPIEIDQRHAGVFGGLARTFIVVPRAHARPAGHEGFARRDAASAQTEDRDVLSLE